VDDLTDAAPAANPLGLHRRRKPTASAIASSLLIVAGITLWAGAQTNNNSFGGDTMFNDKLDEWQNREVSDEQHGGHQL